MWFIRCIPFGWCFKACASVLLCLLAGLAQAQSDAVELEFRKPDAAETLRLNKLLSQPVDATLTGAALRQLYWDKENAARIVGDIAQREQVLRAAVAALADPGFKRNLGQLLMAKGQFDAGFALMKQAAAEGGPVEHVFSTSTMVCDLFTQNRDAEARALAQEVDGKITGLLRRMKDPEKQVKLWRAAARRADCLSQLEDRIGHTRQATEYARSSEQYARMALQQNDSQSTAAAKAGTLIDVAGALARKLGVSLAADQLNDAEAALGEYVRFSRDYQLPAFKQADLYKQAGHLRFAQREFMQSERFLRKADGLLASLGQEPTGHRRSSNLRDVVMAQIGQHQWQAALAELERYDRLLAQAAATTPKTQFPLVRGLVYLENAREQEAVALLELAASQMRTQYGPAHFYTAQASGLHGAALWRSNSPALRARALPLLKTAVRDFMAPGNADFLLTTGIRKEIQEIVFSAYLDAAASTSVQEAVDALGPADWARGGVVKDALNDAAVRSAAATPALAEVVRREQDAKNEISGLRRFLAGELGASETPLPQVAAQMRERIAALEAERVKLQAEVKAKFPNYDQLIRPQAPSAQDIAHKLAPDQVLLHILPSRGAVYVWAISKDQGTGFAKADITEAQVKQLVAKLRSQLDFGTASSAGTLFDGAAAHALYDKLLAPMAAQLERKTMLIVAAGGALSQLPFGLLQTAAGGGSDAQAPWLIRKMSVSQVPSLSSWLAIKSLGRAKSASQAFAGWADPAFALQAASASPTSPATRRVALTRAAAPGAGADPEDITSLVAPGLLYASIPTLPETREELQSIAAALQADPQQDLLLGSGATRDSVLQASSNGSLGNKRVLAFATHGLMAGDLPSLTQPALALAATGREVQEPLAALLTLQDVLTLKLNADWVVLSACNTAAEDGRGDEVMSGLARGFFYAGSRALLVTHWAVESESAKMLTTETFKHYVANPGAPKAESLRQAMLKVMGLPPFRHPAYWAPYALVGDGGR
jgi:CHAT domain-containing protein